MAVGRSAPDRRAVLAGLASVTAGGASAEAAFPSLRQAAARRGRLYGAAVEPEDLDKDPAYAALAARHCAVLVPENAMKWDAVHGSPTGFSFERADRLVAQAQGQRALVHGHCLVWHQALPSWMPRTLSRAQAVERIQTHIAAVVGRYAGKVRSWDVVNEAIERADHRPDGLRRSLWLEAVGPEYLDLSFQAAHDSDPKARLALSDYGLEYDDIPWMAEKRAAVLAQFERLLGAGAPVHALGIQAHLLGDRPPAFGAGLRRFLRDVASLGLRIYVTELDVDDRHMAGDPAWRDRRTADIYRRFLDVVLDEPAVEMVNTWGLSDRRTSKADLFPRADRQPVRPLPFDEALAPKPAARAMLAAFRGARQAKG